MYHIVKYVTNQKLLKPYSFFHAGTLKYSIIVSITLE